MQAALRLSCSLCLVLAASEPLGADLTTRVSVSSAEAQGAGASGTGPVHAVAVSADGTRVVFVAAATNLVPGDTNGHADVFVRDLITGTTERCSVSTSGAQGDEKSYLPRISPNGRYVAFTTFASTLVAGDTNGWADVFVRDLATNTTRRESVSTGGVQGNLNSESPSLSINGQWLVFWSNASNLVSGDLNGTGDIFLRDTFNGVTRLITQSATAGQANDNSYHAHISADANTVAYVSQATNLDSPDTNGHRDVFLYSPSVGTIGRVDRGPAHPEPDGPSSYPTLSSNGRYVAFTTEATNLIAGDTNGVEDIYVYDRTTEIFERVSVASGGGQGNGASFDSWISEDGRYVVFESEASNLVPDDNNGWQDVFRHDRQTGETRLMSRDSAGQVGNGMSFHCALSANGATVAFGSHASDLVANDTNSQPDVFIRAPEPPPALYCFGSVGACPCGNSGTGNGGCRNSVNPGGARLNWAGSTNAQADDFRLIATQLVPNQPALAFVGNDSLNGGNGFAFGDGLRCAGTAVLRLGVQAPSGSTLTYGPGLGASGGWAPGDRRFFQVWYRDPQGPCGSGFNLTNGLRVDFGS